MQINQEIEREYVALKSLVAVEDLAEKKIRIFSRILMDATLAKEMETLAQRHEQRKETLLSRLGEKNKKEKEE